MKKYLVSTTTHDARTHKQIDAWGGDYLEAASEEAARADAVEWEAHLLEGDGHKPIVDKLLGTVDYYDNGEPYYIQVHVDDPEVLG